jgi:hypothetical protein
MERRSTKKVQLFYEVYANRLVIKCTSNDQTLKFVHTSMEKINTRLVGSNSPQ